MLQSISWSTYLTTAITSIAVYYTVVLYLYYRPELLAILRIKMIVPDRRNEADLNEIRKNLGKGDDDDSAREEYDLDITPQVQAFKDEIIAYLAEASSNKLQKSEVLYSLEVIASKYTILNKADCREELIYDVYKEANNYMPGYFELQGFNKLFQSSK